jgi:hypothetical protein
MKIYKTYFKKTDTPFNQDFQPNRKYHVVWKHMPYVNFLNHKVYKIKLLGLFTIYKEEEK